LRYQQIYSSFLTLTKMSEQNTIKMT